MSFAMPKVRTSYSCSQLFLKWSVFFKACALDQASLAAVVLVVADQRFAEHVLKYLEAGHGLRGTLQMSTQRYTAPS